MWLGPVPQWFSILFSFPGSTFRRHSTRPFSSARARARARRNGATARTTIVKHRKCTIQRQIRSGPAFKTMTTTLTSSDPGILICFFCIYFLYIPLKFLPCILFNLCLSLYFDLSLWVHFQFPRCSDAEESEEKKRTQNYKKLWQFFKMRRKDSA